MDRIEKLISDLRTAGSGRAKPIRHVKLPQKARAPFRPNLVAGSPFSQAKVMPPEEPPPPARVEGWHGTYSDISRDVKATFYDYSSFLPPGWEGWRIFVINREDTGAFAEMYTPDRRRALHLPGPDEDGQFDRAHEPKLRRGGDESVPADFVEQGEYVLTNRALRAWEEKTPKLKLVAPPPIKFKFF